MKGTCALLPREHSQRQRSEAWPFGATRTGGEGNETKQPFMPGEAVKRRSGVVADKSKHEKAQEAELEMNERNH